MALQLLPETEISSNGDGSIVYTGEWSECLTILKGFKVTQAEGAYSFVAFVPTATLSAAPTPYTSGTATDASLDWSADEAAIAAAGKLISSGARLRALPGGRGQLTINLSSAEDLRNKIREATDSTTGSSGEQSYSYGVSEVSHSILEAESPETQAHIAAWLSAPSPLKSRFLYLNESTGENAALSGGEKILATKILLGQEIFYVYLPSVTLTMSKMSAQPSGLPTIGGNTGPNTSSIAINLPATGFGWRIINSGSWQNSDGTWSGTVQWIAVETPET